MRRVMVRLREENAGFSVLELVVVVGVVAVVMALLMLSIRQISASYNLTQAASTTLSELRKAQARATAADADYTVELVLGSSGGLNVYQQGQPTPVRTIAPPDWPASVQITTTGFLNCSSVGNPANKCVTFRALGYPAQAGTVLLTAGAGVTRQVVVAPATGRVTVQ